MPHRYTLLSAQILIPLSIVLCLTACNGCYRTEQWNLNKSVGWKSSASLNLDVLYTRLDSLTGSTMNKAEKEKFNASVTRELIARNLDGHVEIDSINDADFYYAVPKQSVKALAIILEEARYYQLDGHITIYRREYESIDKWTDKIVYPD